MTTTQTAQDVTPAAPAREVVGTPAADTPTPGPLGSRFTALLTTTGLANLGDGIVQMGAPLVALTLTRSPGQIALLSAAAWLPWLLLGLAGGVAIDRTDRRVAQVVALTARAALLGVGAWLALTDALSMPALVVLVLLYGVTEVFADLAQTSLVPDVVPRDRLQAANGRLIAVQQVTNTFVGGPVAGGLLALGTGWVFGLPAALAVVAVAVLLRGVPGRYKPERTAPSKPVDDVREGLRYVVHHPVLRPFVIGGGIMNMASTAYFAVFVLWVVGPGSRLEMRPEHFPLVTAVLAVGAVVGSLLTERLVARLPELGVMYACWLACVPLMLVPVLFPNVPALAAAMFLVGLTNTVGNTLSQSLRQRIVPRALLGRTTGAGRTIGFGLMPVGAVLGGVVAEHAGLPTVFVGATAVTALAIAYPMLTVRRGTVERAEAAAHAATPTAAA
ncbi:MFS transporter [Cellulomonas uda]|uniref:MFS transporter n=1 Tax=Cellulomonas uda TaxID=1714 RepID=A0A4Y3KEL8_CELUD|nr:MFS transporter [Cellulomonas uda]NII67730.1 MFS family permease [Cellulomonas uda]GEA82467.1 MFS transporter [Cellulomonas uda]